MLNSGQNRRFFVPCDLEIWQITLKNNRAPLLYCFKLCASFHSHQWIQTGVTVRKRPIWVKIDVFFVSCDLEICKMILKNNRAPLISCFKLCASFESHRQIKTQVTVRKRSIRVKIGDFFVMCDLEIWLMTLKNNRTPLLWCIMKFSGVITNDKSDVHAKGQGQRSRSQRSTPNLTVSGLLLQFEFTYDDEMMHIAWWCLEEVPYCFWRSSVKFQGHTALKSVEFDQDWAFPDCNSSLNSPMATKWCTKLEVA